MYIQALMADQFGIDMVREGGLEVITTLDLDLQQEAEAIVRRRLDQLNCRTPGICDETTDPNRRVDNAGAVVLDSRTGEILAMVGSPDYFDPSIQGNVNAALTLRQPGSAVKPLTYAAALDPAWSAQAGVEPLTPASIIADLPATFHVTDETSGDESSGNVPYTPQNYDRSFHGPVSVRTALANSYNIPAVKVLERIGVQTLQEIAAAAGISSFTNEYGLALTLGGGEVKLLELAAAFGMLDDGMRLETNGILEIERLGEFSDDVLTGSAARTHLAYPIPHSPNLRISHRLSCRRLSHHRYPRRSCRPHPCLWRALCVEFALRRCGQNRYNDRLARQLDRRLFDRAYRRRLGGQCRQRTHA